MGNSKVQTNIVKDILDIASKAASNALQAVNTQLVIRNWLIGKRISEEILTTRSNDYGKQIIKNLAIELSSYSSGFDFSSLYKYYKFYNLYKNLFKSNDSVILEPLVPKSNCPINNLKLLPASFYLVLIRIKDPIERKWYEEQSWNCGWSRRELERNVKTDMYHRLLSNQIPTSTKTLINKQDNLKSLMIFEFLGLNKNDKYKESQLEQALIDNITKFMLELGNGYSFVGRQYHLRTSDNDYYIDLVFYNTILKRYLLIDLKVGKIKHQDIGQMLLYLRLFDKKNNIDEGNKSIGMILSSDLNSDIVHYLMDETKDNVVASKYLVYLPTKEEIRKELLKICK